MPEPPPPDASPPLTGRRPADRRLRVERAHSPYFRCAAPGVITAKPAAILPNEPVERVIWGLRRAVFGRLLATEEEIAERLSNVKALATFSSDNLSSVAYATELIMFTLLSAGTAAFWLVLPISGLIVTIFVIIVISYRQTIRAYPSGGGSYIVARENLGTGPALLAAAALLTDYVLTVSVSVAAGVAAILSAFPRAFDDLRVPFGVVAILVVTTVNLRGIRESGTIFAIPTTSSSSRRWGSSLSGSPGRSSAMRPTSPGPRPRRSSPSRWGFCSSCARSPMAAARSPAWRPCPTAFRPSNRRNGRTPGRR